MPLRSWARCLFFFPLVCGLTLPSRARGMVVRRFTEWLTCVATTGKIKTVELRSKDKSELETLLADHRKQLGQLRIEQISGVSGAWGRRGSDRREGEKKKELTSWFPGQPDEADEDPRSAEGDCADSDDHQSGDVASGAEEVRRQGGPAPSEGSAAEEDSRHPQGAEAVGGQGRHRSCCSQGEPLSSPQVRRQGVEGGGREMLGAVLRS